MTAMRKWSGRTLMVALVWVAAACNEVAGPVPGPGGQPEVATVAVVPLDGAWTGVLHVGQVVALRAQQRAADGAELPPRPVNWSSSDESVVRVDARGRIEARGPGSALIRADVAGRTGSTMVTVVAEVGRTVGSVAVAPAANVMKVGATRQYTARVFAVDGTELHGRPVDWSSADPAVATVGMTGIVQAVARGYSDIRATVEGVTGTVSVTVEHAEDPVEQEVRWVVVAPGEAAVYRTQYVQLRGIALGVNGGEIVGKVITWTSSDPAIATVGANGLVLGVSPGTARIRAEADGKVGYAMVTVRAFPLPPVQEYRLIGTETWPSSWVEIGQLKWHDAAGREHDAYRIITAGRLRLDFDSGRYRQTLTVHTYLNGSTPVTPVEVQELVDEGDIGWQVPDMNMVLMSRTSPGSTLSARVRTAGEWIIPQSVLGYAAVALRWQIIE